MRYSILGVALISIVLLFSTLATAQSPDLLTKAYNASVMIRNLNNPEAEGMGFVVQANTALVVVSVNHVYEAGYSPNAKWAVTRQGWDWDVGVQPARIPPEFAHTDLRMFISSNMPLPRGCDVTPLRLFNTPRKGERIYMVGNFYEGKFDQLLSGKYVGTWDGFAHCTVIPGNGPGTSGSPVLNGAGHVVGIMSGSDRYQNGEQYDRFVPIETYERYREWISEETRRRR